MANTSDEHKLVVALEARVRNFERAMSRAQRSSSDTVSRIEGRFAGMQRNLDRGFRNFSAGLASALSVATLTQAGRAIRAIIADVDNLAKASQRIGFESSGSLQTLRYAAELSGVAVSQLDRAMQFFSRSVGEAARGSGALKDILSENGIALRDSEGNVRDLNALLADYSNLVARAGSESEQLSLSTRAFGEDAGAGMVVMLRGGSEALADMREEAVRLGGVLDDDLVKVAEQVEDRLTRLATTIRGNVNRSILETITIIDRLAEGARGISATLNAAYERTLSDEQRMRGAMGNYGFQTRHGLSTQSQNFFDRSSFRMPTGESPAPVVVPAEREADTESRTRNAVAIRGQTEATAQLIRELQFELDLVGMSEQEQAIATAQRRAGAEATDEQRAQIASLITARMTEADAIERQSEAHRANEESMQYLGEMAYDGLMSIASGAETAEDALKRMAIALAESVAQAALFGNGPLAGVFGGGGVLSGLFRGVGMPMQLADGGKVSGPGSSTSDSIPAMLSDGEFVVNARAVRQPGMRALLDRVNALDLKPMRFASGGFATALPTGEHGAEFFA